MKFQTVRFRARITRLAFTVGTAIDDRRSEHVLICPIRPLYTPVVELYSPVVRSFFLPILVSEPRLYFQLCELYVLRYNIVERVFSPFIRVTY